MDEGHLRALMLQHPIISKKSRAESPLWTLPISNFYDNARTLLFLRQSFFIEEIAGEGKTIMMNVLRERLPRDLSEIHVLSYRGLNREIFSHGGFVRDLLYTVNHAALDGNSYELSRRLINDIVASALETNWKLIVMLVDEAQALRPIDFGFIKDLHNELEEVRIDFVVICCGESPKIRELFRTLSSEQQIGCLDRYFRHRLRLSGYGLEELQDLLEVIDVKRWPTDFGPTWTEFCFPLGYASGFRLANQASLFWQAMKEVHLIRDDKISEPSQDGKLLSRRIFDALGFLAFKGMDKDCPNFEFPKEDWQSAAKFAAKSAWDEKPDATDRPDCSQA